MADPARAAAALAPPQSQAAAFEARLAQPHVFVQSVLDAVYFGSTLRAWITAATIFAVTFAVLLFARRVPALRRHRGRAHRPP